jgi:glucuronate isomerase
MTPPFIHEDFLLENRTARRLYHEIAASLPIIDYHCHLPPQDVARNRRFADLFEIWLAGDHYKWRALRANGIPEELITGSASPKQKFLAWARTVPATYRNPLYHWSHLELARYFDIYDLLDEKNAEAVWETANARLTQPDFDAQGILRRMQVEVVGTTDDPADPLIHHEAFATSGHPTRMVPTFRPDKAHALDDPSGWNDWVDRLSATAALAITDFDSLLAALHSRHGAFHALGGRLSDHGLSRCPAAFATPTELDAIFRKVRNDTAASPLETEQFATHIVLETARWNHARGWTLQLHVGAQRNNNSRLFARLGRDAGFDSIGDEPQAASLARFLDALDTDDRLPRTVLYNLNPADNHVFATMIGNFNDGTIPGKVQWGSGWWFLDQKDGIESQLNALSNCGLLRRFVGMITDSRSFLSYPRHEYFRRILCNILGREAERGEIPNDFARLSEYVEAISYSNARDYFQFS